MMASRALKIDPRKAASNADNLVEPRTVVNENAVTALAYQLWQKRGCPIGSDEDDWFRAESELKAQKRQPNKAA